ncbi:hypothetical protein [Thiothrix subterranea]|uniref:hypothetical protein n=1 Tax=Thiothrix subterranea TaxID=2735563 RepID=UPI00280B837B|nr:hypothetical protein [Thiothrix subterranea]
MAHKAADLVFEKLTGVKGAFDTRIAYVSASGPAKNQTYQLIVSDADGFNPRTIVSSRKPVMSPVGRRMAGKWRMFPTKPVAPWSMRKI